MALDDRMVLTITSHAFADTAIINPFVNVFAYQVTSGTGSTASLRNGFVGSILPDILLIQSSTIVYDLVTTVNLDDPTDFDITALTDVGAVSGEFLPLFNGWEFQYVRAVRGVHHGRKTIAGVPENLQSNGVITPGNEGLVNGAAAAMEATVLQGGNAYTPRIWRRAGNYGTPPVAFPDTFYPIVAVVYNRISTQSSRKR